MTLISLVWQNGLVWPDKPEISATSRSSLVQTASKSEKAIVTIYGTKTDRGVIRNRGWFGVVMPTITRTMGTGFIVSTDGKIMTNKHVVENISAKYVVITSNGDKYTVDKIYRDPTNDIAIIEVDPKQHPDNKLTAVSLGDSNQVKRGQGVTTVAAAPSEAGTIKFGKVDGIRYAVIASDVNQSYTEKLKNVIQTNLDLVPGNSGSPLIDSSGKVVGINTATGIDGQSVGYAIPIEAAKSFLETIPTCSC